MKSILINRAFYFSFWERAPALVFGFALYFSLLLALNFVWALFPTLLFFFTLPKNTFWKICLLFFAAFFFFKIEQRFPSQGQGTAHLTIEAISKTPSAWIYRAKIHSFHHSDKSTSIRTHLPCRIFLKPEWERPPGNCSYLVSGELKTRDGLHWSFKPDPEKSWLIVNQTFSFAELRFQAKEKMRVYLEKCLPDRRATLFLTGLATGEFHDIVMLKEFGNLGLTHLMAISGFHFSLFALFLDLLFRKIFSQKKKAMILIFFLTLYFLFLGSSPSIQRAWIFSFVFYLGELFEKKPRAVNSLGIALIAGILCEPLNAFSLSFQLSFLATAGILWITPGLDYLMQKAFIKRSFEEVIKMNGLNQHGYLLMAHFRKLFSLAISVHSATFLLILHCFHAFPMQSLIYNLFFPLLASLSIFLLFAGCLLGPFGKGLHHFNSSYTETILRLTESPPAFFSGTWYLERLDQGLVIVFLTLLFFMGIFLEQKRKQANA